MKGNQNFFTKIIYNGTEFFSATVILNIAVLSKQLMPISHIFVVFFLRLLVLKNKNYISGNFLNFAELEMVVAGL